LPLQRLFGRNATFIQPNAPQVLCIDVNGDAKIHRPTQLGDAKGVDKLSVINLASQRTLMAAINSYEASERSQSVKLYDWNLVGHHFNESARQVIYVSHPTAVHLAKETRKDGESAFLIVAEGEDGQLRNKPLIRIHLMNPSLNFAFIEVQQISAGQNVLSFDSLSNRNDGLLVFALLKNSVVHLYKHRGASGFTLVDTLSGNGANRMLVAAPKAFFSNSTIPSQDHYVILSKMEDQEQQIKGHTIILESHLFNKVIPPARRLG